VLPDNSYHRSIPMAGPDATTIEMPTLPGRTGSATAI